MVIVKKDFELISTHVNYILKMLLPTKCLNNKDTSATMLPVSMCMCVHLRDTFASLLAACSNKL